MDPTSAEKEKTKAAEADGLLTLNGFVMAVVFVGLSITDSSKSGKIAVLLEVLSFCFLVLSSIWAFLRKVDSAGGGGFTDYASWLGIVLFAAGIGTLGLSIGFIAWSSMGSSPLRFGTTITLGITATIAVLAFLYATAWQCCSSYSLPKQKPVRNLSPV